MTETMRASLPLRRALYPAITALLLLTAALNHPLSAQTSTDAPARPMTRIERADRMETAPTETLYLQNAPNANDGNETLTVLRLILDPSVKLFLVPAQNAIVIRALPDDIALARKVIASIDRPHQVYRVSLTLTESDAGKPVSVQHAALTMERGQRTTLRRGMKLPVVTGSTGTGADIQTTVTYLDVGLNVDLTLSQTATGGALKYSLEESSVGDEKSTAAAADPVIHQTTVQGVTMLTSGKPSQLCALDLPGTSHKLDVEATLEPVH